MPPQRRSRLSQQASLREVMAQFATGVTVLTAGGRDGHGMTANAFSSVSLDPPLVLCCVSRAARMHEAIMAAQSFAVSILGAEQQELARYFADWKRPRGRAQFDAVDWQRGPRTGAPLLTGALAWLECELVKVYAGGDHSIFLGEVLDCSRGTGPEALLFFGGDFHQIGRMPA
ncbi:flavin reductase family protein [Amycolatopsis arida]|uniref:flavin reductase family protein n=1 Tax=Amycolatopsis arida TaxID=587909 RepID=UPI003C7B1416